jgi:hypothetical protein
MNLSCLRDRLLACCGKQELWIPKGPEGTAFPLGWKAQNLLCLLSGMALLYGGYGWGFF